MTLELKKFDMKNISFKPNEMKAPVCVLIGRRGTGKSVLVRDVLYYHQDIPIGVVVAGTEEGNGYYGKMVPKLFIHNEYNTTIIENILKGYKYEGINGLITSTFPSLKYNLFMSILSVSTIVTFVSEAIGLGFYSVVAVVLALFAELGSGVYCSLWIRKEKFESGKLSRFGLKVSLLFIVLFITNSWKNDFVGQALKEL